jgi:hypothetical protein
MSGHDDGLTEERRIRNMLEAGYNVFMLRWKKLHSFQTSIFGFEIVHPTSRIDLKGEVRYSCQVEKGELCFHPDEELPEDQQIPIAYVADTPHNRLILRNDFFHAPYVIGGLITPTGTTPAHIIQGQIEAEARANGGTDVAKAEGKMQFSFGSVTPAELEAMIEEKIHGRKPEPKIEKTEAPKGRTVVAKPEKPLNVGECKDMAEKNVYTLYDIFVKQMQKQYGPHWKKTKQYKDTFADAIQEEYERLLTENGHTIVRPAAGVPAAEEIEAVPAETVAAG